MKSRMMRLALAGLVVTVFALASTETVRAQCSTCATPTVAYQPVVAQPVVAQTTVAYQPDNRWYLGKAFDNMRLRSYQRSYDRRYGSTAAAQTYTAAYAPYTTGYAPYSVSYAPNTAAYRPYVTSYAPLATTTVARPVMQTSYYVPAVSSCSSCVQTVARPVVLSPVCSSCSTGCSSCSACSSCSTGVGQASYAQPACASCAGAPAASSLPAASVPSATGSGTGQPYLTPDENVPTKAGYPPNVEQDPVPEPEPAEKDDFKLDEDKEAPGDASTLFEAPQLLNPRDRTANRSSSRVSVDVRNAVYRQPLSGNTSGQAVTQTSYKPVQVNQEADGWSSVPRN